MSNYNKPEPEYAVQKDEGIVEYYDADGYAEYQQYHSARKAYAKKLGTIGLVIGFIIGRLFA